MDQTKTWTSHLIFAATIVVVLGYPIGTVAALTAAVAFFLGRERRDREIYLNLPAKDWYKGWEIWKWTKDNRNDFLYAVAGAGVGALVIRLLGAPL